MVKRKEKEEIVKGENEGTPFAFSKRRKQSSSTLTSVNAGNLLLSIPSEVYSLWVNCPHAEFQILYYIFGFLDFKNILVASQVCKLFNSIGSNETTWKKECDRYSWKPVRKNQTYKAIFLQRMRSRNYCLSCGVKTSIKLDEWDLIVCQKCRTAITINKGTSKYEYCLTDADLEGVTYHVQRSWWGRKTYLYLEREIEELALKRHGGPEGLAKARKARDTRKQALQDKKEQIKQQRKQEFDAELLRLNIVVKPWARDYYNRYVDQVADDDGEVPTMEDTIAHLKKFDV